MTRARYEIVETTGRLGLCIRFDGDLAAPDGTEEWWQS